MQRNQFKTTILPTDSINRTGTQHNNPKINTFSDCIKESVYTAVNKHLIHVRNSKIDKMENLI